MQLYYAPLACSLVARVALLEAGIGAEPVRVSLLTKQTADGTDYHSINPKGQVPALRLEDGGLLTEGPAVIQYIVDRAPGSGLAPAPGTPERYCFLEWLSHVASEIHKASLWPIMHPHAGKETRGFTREVGKRRFAHLDRVLETRDFLVGDGYTIADTYLAWAMTIARIARYELELWPNLGAYTARIAQREGFKAAMAIEMPEAIEDFPQLASIL